MRHKTVWVYNEVWFTDERMLFFFSSQNHEICVCTEFELCCTEEKDREQKDERGRKKDGESVMRKHFTYITYMKKKQAHIWVNHEPGSQFNRQAIND